MTTTRNAEVDAARSALGVAARRKDPAAVAAARQELAAAKLEAYITKIVAEWPPLSPEQRDRLSMLFRGEESRPTTPVRPKVSALMEAEARLSKVRSEFSEALAVCQGCDLAEKVHHFQKDTSLGFHDFVPLSPDGAIKVAQLYKKKIAAAEKALEQAKEQL